MMKWNINLNIQMKLKGADGKIVIMLQPGQNAAFN
jgi:hypothetical protein